MTTEPTKYPADHIAWYSLGILVVAYTFSYIDRTILTLLVGPIRTSLQISDTQISLLHGFAFAIFYTFLGIPIGRLADRHHRVRITVVGILLWSAMTALCGMARNFIQMFLARVGVGIGEAALGPSAYSILTDNFPPSRLPLAMSIYTASLYVGSGIAVIAGGALISMVPALDLPVVGHVEPWQAVFFVFGGPGIVIAGLMATVPEPTRRGLLMAGGAALMMPLRVVLRYLRERRGAYFLTIGGFACLSLAYNGVTAWIPTYFIRVHEWTPRMAGVNYGLVVAIFGATGIITGGKIAMAMKARGHRAANVKAGIISGCLMLPTGIIAPLLDNAYVSLAVYACFIFGASYPWGAAAAGLQELTPNQMRGTVTAIRFLCLNIAGIGIGPTVVATFTDRVFGNDADVYLSNAVVPAIMVPIGMFLLWRAINPFARAAAEAGFRD